MPDEKASKSWDIALLKPNGSNLKSTNYQLCIKATAGEFPSIASGEKITFKVTGILGKEAGTALVKVIERRPGAPILPLYIHDYEELRKDFEVDMF